MIESLSAIIQDSKRIAGICSEYTKNTVIEHIQCSTTSVDLSPIAPSVLLAQAMNGLSEVSACKINHLFAQHVAASEKDTQAAYTSTISRLCSFQKFGGMSDIQSIALLDQTFSRQHTIRVQLIDDTLVKLLQQGRTVEKADQSSSSFSNRTVSVLESAFQRKATLNNAENVAVSQMAGVTPHQVRTWFQNRRNRHRKSGKSLPSLQDEPEFPPPPPSRTISALPRRSAPMVSKAGTTLIAGGSARRMKAMPRRAFPPKPSQSSSSTPYPSGPLHSLRRELSPAPSMARSLSAHSSASDVSSVDPSGGFNSLLISPTDAPTQVTLPHPDTGMGFGYGYGYQGVDNWTFDLNLPQTAQFNYGSDLSSLNLDLMGFDFSNLGGNGLLGGDLNGMDGLTLTSTPNFSEGSTSPSRAQDGGEGLEGVMEGSEEWLWAGSIAEQMAALFEGEGKAWIEEAGNVAGGEVDLTLPTPSIEDMENKEEASATDSPSRSSERSESRSVTPPPLPQIHTTQPTPTSKSTLDPNALPFETLAIPIPYFPYPTYSYPTSVPYDQSRVSSYGSSSSGSTRIITPPSSQYGGYQYENGYAYDPQSQGQGGQYRMSETRSGSGQGVENESGEKAGAGYNTSTIYSYPQHPQQLQVAYQPYHTYQQHPSSIDNPYQPIPYSTQGMQQQYILHPQNPNYYHHYAAQHYHPLQHMGESSKSGENSEKVDSAGPRVEERWTPGVLAFDT